ncbi:DUF4129 domain-containing protein [Amnibacterium kyonggiense]|uniref:Uncharacterized protein DUF4129 n=1 Tax=Amnibacterium kyonggiense TaxID=595671 RepID=A0A4R7FGU8_9MICO|nr:DUF4129 domain-containing protein [Amnibacterium kyonggiense]TDS74820.1 uncharacterized protein DUF4129 [Amnibacterium kyonggiense]
MIASPAAVPVQPDAGTARNWLLDELAKPSYAAAQPSPFDRAVQAFLQWFSSLFDPKHSDTPPIALVIALLVVLAVVVVALLLFGLPRRNRRSAAGTLFGADDRRSAAEMRRAADAAMAAGDWSLAVLERFRALARGLDERTLVAVFPGTTATGFAVAAARAFPAELGELQDAAELFDGVRYADEAATREDALSVVALDDRLAAARPQALETA